MLNIFYKNPIEFQLDDYFSWKKARGIYTPENDVKNFIKFCKIKDVREIEEKHIQEYHDYLREITEGEFTIFYTMKDVRCMFRYFKARKYQVVNPNVINEHGILIRPNNSDILNDMKKRKVGRPAQIESIKKIKLLKDQGGLTFREISLVVKKDLKTVFSQYKYNLPKEMLAK